MPDETDWWEVVFTIVCLAPALILIIYMALRVVT